MENEPTPSPFSVYLNDLEYQRLARWFERHEQEIALGAEDYSALRPIFIDLMGREAREINA